MILSFENFKKIWYNSIKNKEKEKRIMANKMYDKNSIESLSPLAYIESLISLDIMI